MYLTRLFGYTAPMSTAWVECWKCDECGFRWIKTEVWPERCASSKCRKRSWNKSGSGERQTQESAPVDKTTAHSSNVRVSNPASPTKPKVNPAMAQFLTTHPIHHPEPIEETITLRRCLECDNAMREVKGKWACVDVGCAMYGREQRCRP